MISSSGLLIRRKDSDKLFVCVRSNDPQILSTITDVAEKAYAGMGYEGFSPKFDGRFYPDSTGFIVYRPSNPEALAVCRFVAKNGSKIPIEYAILQGSKKKRFSVAMEGPHVDVQRVGELNSLIALDPTAVPALLTGLCEFLHASRIEAAFSVYDTGEGQAGYRLGRFYEGLGFRKTAHVVHFPDYRRSGDAVNWQVIRLDKLAIEEKYETMKKGEEKPFKNHKVIGELVQGELEEDLEGLISKMQAGLP